MANDNRKQNVDQSLFVFAKDVNTGKIKRVAIPADLQVGTTGNPSELQLLGSLSLATTDFVSSVANGGGFYLSNHDTIAAITTSYAPSAGIVVKLPSRPRDGQLHFIKDASGTAGSTSIVVSSDVPSHTIDGASNYTISTDNGTLAVFWYKTQWHVLVSATGGGSGAPTSATYVTLSNNASLTAERVLTAGSGISITDNGANNTVVIAATGAAGGAPTTATYLTLSTDGTLTAERVLTAGTNITFTDNGAGNTLVIDAATGAPINSAYVTIGNDATLSAERALTAGSNIVITDGGANGNVTVAAVGVGDPGASYVVMGLTGSLPNERVLTAGTGISIVDGGAGGAVTITATGTSTGGGDPDASYVVLATTSSLSNERVLTAGSNIVISDGGANGNVTVSAVGVGDPGASYVVLATTSSLSNERVLAAGSNIVISDGGANSNVTVSAVGVGDPGASYVVLGLTSSLSNERVLTAGTGISITDNGANGSVVINCTVSGTAGGSGGDPDASYIVLGLTSSLSNERVLTAGSGVTLVDSGPNGTLTITVTSASIAALPKQDNIPIVAGLQSTDQAVFTAISAFEFNPTGAETMAPSGSTSFTAYFRPIVEVYPAGAVAEVRLYNLTLNTVVANTLMSSTSLLPERLISANLTGSLASGSNLYEMHMRLQATGPSYRAVCKGAKLFVTWR